MASASPDVSDAKLSVVDLVYSGNRDVEARTIAALTLACTILVTKAQTPTTKSTHFKTPIQISFKGVSVVLDPAFEIASSS